MIELDAQLKIFLGQLGIDIDKTLERFCESTDLLLKFLLRFPNDENYKLAVSSYADNDKEQFRNAVHTLKGVSGNLGITRVFDECQNIMVAVRENPDADIDECFNKLCMEYDYSVEIIKKMEAYLNSK